MVYLNGISNYTLHIDKHRQTVQIANISDRQIVKSFFLGRLYLTNINGDE